MRELTIELTNKCPNMCKFCSSNGSPHGKDSLEITTVVDIIMKAKAANVTDIYISGGEPFTYKFRDLQMICNLIHTCGMRVILYTSGIMFNRIKRRVSIPESYFKKLKPNVDRFVFDLQTANLRAHKFIMGTDTFDKVCKSIQRATKAGCVVETNIIPNICNCDNVIDYIDLCIYLGISRINVLKLVVQGRACQHTDVLQLTDRATTKFVHQMVEYGTRFGLSIRCGIPWNPITQDTHLCNAYKDKLVITPTRHILPCESFKKYMSNDNNGSNKKFSFEQYNFLTNLDCYYGRTILNNKAIDQDLVRKYYDFKNSNCSCFSEYID